MVTEKTAGYPGGGIPGYREWLSDRQTYVRSRRNHLSMTGPESHGIIFSEVQQFRQVWIWLLVGFLAVLAWFSAVWQVLLGRPFGTNPAPDLLVLVILVILGVGFPLWFLVMRLETEVTPGLLRFRFFPLHIRWREVPAAEIAGADSVVYRPIRDYGGWGIRFGKDGRAYNVSGNRGVVIRLVSGRSFMLGSERPEELERAVRGMHR